MGLTALQGLRAAIFLFPKLSNAASGVEGGPRFTMTARRVTPAKVPRPISDL